MHKQQIDAATGRDMSSLRVRCSARLDRDLVDVKLGRLPRYGTPSSRSDALNCQTMWDCARTSELLDRLGSPELETMANRRVMRWIGNVARMHPG